MKPMKIELTDSERALLASVEISAKWMGDDGPNAYWDTDYLSVGDSVHGVIYDSAMSRIIRKLVLKAKDV
jgi:hypothetical protein